MAFFAAEGAKRVAEAALWANGGFEVQLRMPGLAASSSEAEQLGLATPQFEDVPLGPAVWRKLATKEDLLVSASAVTALLGSQQFASARSLFQSAVGVVVEGVLYPISACESLPVAGIACAYRIGLEEPLWT